MTIALGGTSRAAAGELPPGGTTAWEVRGVEEIVTFLLFDPATPGVLLPAGLRFVPAREIGMPEIQEHLEQHPEHAEWAFSIVEIIRDDAFLLDGKAPARPEGGATGLWMAEVDPSQLAAEIGEIGWNAIAPSHGAMLVLGLWIPDPEYAAYMRARGHHAEYGMVTLRKDAEGALHGEITSDGLHVEASAEPHGEATDELVSGTQLQFAPGKSVEHAIVIAGANPRHRDCIGEWSKSGDHPLARGVFVGPTYLTTYPDPLTGSAYPLRDHPPALPPPAGRSTVRRRSDRRGGAIRFRVRPAHHRNCTPFVRCSTSKVGTPV